MAIITGRKWWVLVVPCLLIIAFFSLTTPPVVELPARGSAGNASGQVALPPLSVEIHDDGVTVHQGDNLIETLPWVDDPGLDDLSTVLQQVEASDPEGRVAAGSGRRRQWGPPGSRITLRETPRVARA